MRSQAILHFFRSPIHWAHRAVIFATAQLSCWKCWRSKFEVPNKCIEVEQCVDSDVVVDKFANHFCAAYKANDVRNAEMLYKHYLKMRTSYCGFPISDDRKQLMLLG